MESYQLEVEAVGDGLALELKEDPMLREVKMKFKLLCTVYKLNQQGLTREMIPQVSEALARRTSAKMPGSIARYQFYQLLLASNLLFDDRIYAMESICHSICRILQESRGLMSQTLKLAKADQRVSVLQEGLDMLLDLGILNSRIPDMQSLLSNQDTEGSRQIQKIRESVKRPNTVGRGFLDAIRLMGSAFEGLELEESQDREGHQALFGELLNHYEEALYKRDLKLQYQTLTSLLRLTRDNTQDVGQMLRFEALIEELEYIEATSPGQIACETPRQIIGRKHATAEGALSLVRNTEGPERKIYCDVIIDLLTRNERAARDEGWATLLHNFEIRQQAWGILQKSNHSEGSPSFEEAFRIYKGALTAFFRTAALFYQSGRSVQSKKYAVGEPLRMALTEQKSSGPKREPDSRSSPVPEGSEGESPNWTWLGLLEALSSVSERDTCSIADFLVETQRVLDSQHPDDVTEVFDTEAQEILVQPDAEIGELRYWTRNENQGWHAPSL